MSSSFSLLSKDFIKYKGRKSEGPGDERNLQAKRVVRRMERVKRKEIK